MFSGRGSAAEIAKFEDKGWKPSLLLLPRFFGCCYWWGESVVRLVPQAIGIVQPTHFTEQEFLHFREFVGVVGVFGEIGEHGVVLGFAVFGDKLVRVFRQVEELGFADGAVQDVELGELTIAFF